MTDPDKIKAFIDESRKVCEAATENWYADCDLRKGGAHQICRLAPDRPAKSLTVCFMATPKEDTEADMVFAVHARTALPAALDIIEGLIGENELLKVHNRELRALAIERDALSKAIDVANTSNDILTRRVKELEQKRESQV